MIITTFLNTHTYADGRPPHIWTCEVIGETKELCMNYIKKRYPTRDGYKSDIVDVYEA